MSRPHLQYAIVNAAAGAAPDGAVVVFEAGVGGGARSWDGVAALLDGRARTIRYDRVGYGAPSASKQDARPAATAERLRALLHAQGLPPPYLLVGHSLGALHVRAFALLHPHQTSGLVLVDPTVDALVRSRLPRVALSLLAGGLHAASWALRPGDRRAALREQAGLVPSCRDLWRLEAGRTYPRGGSLVLTAEHGSDLRTRWQAHARLASRIHAGHRLVRGSGHDIPHDDPEAVAGAIAELLDAHLPPLSPPVPGPSLCSLNTTEDSADA